MTSKDTFIGHKRHAIVETTNHGSSTYSTRVTLVKSSRKRLSERSFWAANRKEGLKTAREFVA